MIRYNTRRTVIVAVLTLAAASLHAESVDALKHRLAVSSAQLRDIRGTLVVHPANRSDAREIDKGIIDFLDQGFREADIAYVKPDKYRAQGKAKGIDVTYVVNGNMKQIIAPSLMLKKTDDLSTKRARKQSTLDLGFASDSLWIDNNVRIVSEAKGVTELRLVPKGSNDKRYDLVWLDTKTLKVLKRERHNAGGLLRSINVFTSHKNCAGVPVATVVKVLSADGGLAGTIDFKNIKANSGISPGLFVIK